MSGGGAERVCVNLANNLAYRGWKIELVVLNLNNSVYLQNVSEKVKIINLNVTRARYSFLSIVKYIYKFKPQKILVFNYELSVILILLRILLKLKITIISRNINTLSKIKNLNIKQDLLTKHFIQPLINHFYFKSDHIVNQCLEMQKDLLILKPDLLKKTSVIYNPIEKQIEDYAYKNDLFNIQKKNYLLCIGRLEKQKSFHFAIEAFADLIKNFPDFRLKIVGKGSLEQSLKKKAKELGISDLVDFEGYKKNIIPYYLHAKATILTSIYEGYPNVLIESIALGTPVVAFDCPSGPSEIIKNNVNGYLIKNGDLVSLKKKLNDLISKKFNKEILINTVKQNKSKHVSELYEKLINYNF